MAEKPTKEEKAGKAPAVDLDRLDRALSSAPPPPEDATPIHTEEAEGEDIPMTNDNTTIVEQVNNRGEEQPAPLGNTNPIEDLVDSQTQDVLDELENVRSEVERLIDEINSSRATVTSTVTEHAMRTTMGTKVARAIAEHLAEVRREFAPK